MPLIHGLLSLLAEDALDLFPLDLPEAVLCEFCDDVLDKVEDKGGDEGREGGLGGEVVDEAAAALLGLGARGN